MKMENSLTPRERIIAQIKHQETDFIPYTLRFEEDNNESLENGVLKKLDTHYGNSSWRNKIDNHIVQVPVIKFEGFLNTKLSNPLIEDLYGVRWQMNQKIPHILKSPMDKPSFDYCVFPHIDQFFDDNWYEKAMYFIKNNTDHFLVSMLGFGLFERSWILRGFENALMDSIVNPDFYLELIKRIYEQQMALLDRILNLPIDGIYFSDDWGDQNGIIIGAERWRKCFKPYYAQLYKKAHGSGKYVLNHICGSIAEILPDLIEIGLDVYESVQPEAKNNNPYRLKELYGKQITFWGGLGSQSIIPFGNPNEIKEEVKKLCKKMGKGGGYILSCAKPLQPETPIENVIAIVESFTKQEK